MCKLPDYIEERYHQLKPKILERLDELSSVPKEKYFYELCFCLCTPQSKAKNAMIVQTELENRDFLNKPFDPVAILRRNENYIRFHNMKALRLLEAREKFPEVQKILDSDISNIEKRNSIAALIKGIGMKEASHYLRNIGYRGLAILDRHILKHLVLCGIFKEVPKVSTKKNYLDVEKSFLSFSNEVGIAIDELDLLFWSYETGEIIK